MHENIKSSHPDFTGNWDDLQHFLELANSPIRNELREIALHAWEKYKLSRQYQFVSRSKKTKGTKRGLWLKGDYMRSLTARAINLEGIHIKNICLGYADFRGVNFNNSVFDADEHRGWIAMKGSKFENASFKQAKLLSARLMHADLRGADLSGAEMANANLDGANLEGANLQNAQLQNANLQNVNLAGANMQNTQLLGANLQNVNLVGADMRGANITGSRVYGVSAWDIILDDQPHLRCDLIVTPNDQADVKVDSIEVAQFVYLLLNNSKIRDVLDTVCKKGVLLLGRFTEERKKVLLAIKEKLRELGYLPILFDFERPADKNFTETIVTLTGMCNFVIADITNPKSSPLELKATMPAFEIPFLPIIQKDQDPFSMFADLQNEFGSLRKGRMIDLLTYDSEIDLIRVFDKAIIEPALELSAILKAPKGEAIRTRNTSDY